MSNSGAKGLNINVQALGALWWYDIKIELQPASEFGSHPFMELCKYYKI